MPHQVSPDLGALRRTRIIADLIKQFLIASSQRQVLTIGDLAPLSRLTNGNTSHLLCLNVGQTDDFKTEVFPSLSFACKSGQFDTFTNRNALKTYQDKYFPSAYVLPSATKLERHTYKILQSDNLLSISDQHLLDQLLELFFQNSSYHVNLDLDAQTSVRQRIVTSLKKRKSALTLADLPQLISSLTKSKACLIHISRGTVATIDDRSCSNETYGLASELLFRTSERNVSLRFKPHEPNTYVLWAAAKFGKRLVGDNSAVSGRHYYCIYLPVLPVNESSVKEGYKSNKIIFVCSRRRPTTMLLDLLSFILDAFSRLRYSEYRFDALQSARQTLLQMPKGEVPEHELGYSAFLKSFTAVCTKFLNDIIGTTDAHSATVRLFDQHSRGLRLIAEARGVYDNNSSLSTLQSIVINEHKNTSVNVFTFLNAHKGVEYVYLPRLIASKEGTHTIPEPFKHLGLAKSLMCRADTRSEICFPIRFGDIVIGTMNIESSIIYAFDNDIPYLRLFKYYTEEAYEKNFAQFDIRFFSEQMRIYAAVHELDQYIKLKFFNDKQTQILSELFPFREVKSRNVADANGDIPGAINSWIETAYSHLEKSQRDVFREILRIDFIDENRLVGIWRDSIVAILKNLIQNIIDHGDESSNLVIIDDRTLYEGQRSNILRIYCKMNAIRAEETLDKICVVPIRDATGDLRFGMFLVGAIARSLGGSVFVDRSGVGSSTAFVIQIPYPEARS